MRRKAASEALAISQCVRRKAASEALAISQCVRRKAASEALENIYKWTSMLSQACHATDGPPKWVPPDHLRQNMLLRMVPQTKYGCHSCSPGPSVAL